MSPSAAFGGPALEEQFGLNFAPDAKARQFSFERHARQGAEFGFHGAFNLVKILPNLEMVGILSTLELQVLTKREHREIILLGRSARALAAGLDDLRKDAAEAGFIRM